MYLYVFFPASLYFRASLIILIFYTFPEKAERRKQIEAEVAAKLASSEETLPKSLRAGIQAQQEQAKKVTSVYM